MDGYTNVSPVFMGLEGLYAACRSIYPNQPNPLQVTALVKYWLGGPDPLDYISMYANPGDESRGVPAHWHYISFGLSDLYGDGRVHELSGNDTPSGFGFELTFRLKREVGETAPPTWPAAIMQALAKYVFQSENTLCAGDHVSWHCPLDNSESRIQHMLMTEDPQLGTVMTPCGAVSFVQIVGVCTEELQSAQRWNGPGVIDLMRAIGGVGGDWLVTDMRREDSMFEIDPDVQEAVEQGIETEGSNLSGVSARCSWSDRSNVDFSAQGTEVFQPTKSQTESDTPEISEDDSAKIKATLKKGLLNTRAILPPIKPANFNSSPSIVNQCLTARKESCDSNASNDLATTLNALHLDPTELSRTKTYESLHLQFNLEAGNVIPLALKGRLKHGRHFTFKSVVGDVAITFLAPSVAGAFANSEHPMAARGPWLQVLISEDLNAQMLADFEELSRPESLELPKTYSWPEYHLSITLLPEEY